MNYKIIRKSNYEGRIFCKSYSTLIEFYTKKQIKKLYPNKNFRVVGEINNKAGVQCGTADNFDWNPFLVYKENTHNKLTEGIAGYTAVDTNTYLAVVEDKLAQRIAAILMIAVSVLLFGEILIY